MLSDMAKTTEASFQDDGLWRKLLTRAQKGTTTQAFFVIDVVEGCLHTSMFCKLGLPTTFMRNHFKSLNERIILEGPDGYQWPTMLGLQWDSQPCLMHGWKEFAAAYNLEIQDQVVFLLFENSHFLVQVYDVNNKVKNRRIFASPVQVNNSDMRAKKVTQAETRAPHSDLPSMHGVKTSGKDRVILILDSSEEEEEEEKEEKEKEKEKEKKEDDQVRVKQTPKDACRIGGTSSKMTLRSAKKMEKVDTQDHLMREKLKKSDHSMEDVSPKIAKKLEKSDHWMQDVSPKSVKKLDKSDHSMKDVSKEQKQEHVRQLDGDEEIMDRELGKSKRSDSPKNSAPSSPDHMTVLKRSRRLQRKSGDYQRDDLGPATSVLRSGKLFKLSEVAEKLPPRLYEDIKEPAVVSAKAAFKRVPGSEILTSCCSTQQSTMKKQQRQLQESTSKITEPPVTVPKLHANTESVPELAAPETPGGVPVVKSRTKVKLSKDGGKKRTEKLCLSEDEASKRPTRVGAPGRPPLKLLYVSRRRPVTTQERHDTLAAARTFANKSIDKYCVMQLTTSQVYCGYHLKLQSEFVEVMELPLSRLKVTLSDESGKMWEVEWLGDHPKWPGLHSAGWTKFVLEHYLEEGDVCVFQKSKVSDNMISVEIFPIVPLVAPPEHGWRSHYMVPEIARTAANSQLPDQS